MPAWTRTPCSSYSKSNGSNSRTSMVGFSYAMLPSFLLFLSPSSLLSFAAWAAASSFRSSDSIPSFVYFNIFNLVENAILLFNFTVSKVWKSKSNLLRCSTIVLGSFPMHVLRIVAFFCVQTSQSTLLSPSINSPIIISARESSIFSLPLINNSIFRNDSSLELCQWPHSCLSFSYDSQSWGIFWYKDLPPKICFCMTSFQTFCDVCFPCVAFSIRSSSWSQNSAASFWW